MPEFFYKKVYTKVGKKRVFKPMAMSHKKELFEQQKGYREPLLCQKCETKLSVWEKALSEFTASLCLAKIEEIEEDRRIIVESIDYHRIKKAILSIFWRMSISENTFLFKNFSLGEYCENFRETLYNESLIDFRLYPVCIGKMIYEGEFLNGIIACLSSKDFGRSCFILNGFLFDLFFDDNRTVPLELNKFLLQPNIFIIAEHSYQDYFDTDELKSILGQPHNKDYFDKLIMQGSKAP